MPVDRITTSFTPELGRALRTLARRRGESLSATVEVLLREHPAVREAVQGDRQSGTKKGRNIQKLLAIGDVAKQARRRMEASGRVRFHG